MPVTETSKRQRLVDWFIARNTLDLKMLWVSEALLGEVVAHPMLEQTGPLRGMGFDEDGELAA